MNELESGVPTCCDIITRKQTGIHVTIFSRSHVTLLPDDLALTRGFGLVIVGNGTPTATTWCCW